MTQQKKESTWILNACGESRGLKRSKVTSYVAIPCASVMLVYDGSGTQHEVVGKV